MSAIEKFKSVFEYQVTFADCDPAALAYYPRIIEWCDWASEEMWRRVGKPWHEFFAHETGAGMPLLDIHYSFFYPIRHGDRLTITSWIDAFEDRTFTLKHEIMNGANKAAEATEIRAWTAAAPETEKGIKAVPVPEEVRRLFHKPAAG